MKKTSFLLMLFALLAIGCSNGGEVVGGGDSDADNTGGDNADNVNASHVAKVLVHDFTGTWCGYCADAKYTVKALQDKHPNNVISVAVHRAESGPNNDGSFTFGGYNTFNVRGTPTIWLNNKDLQQNTTLEESITKGIANKKELGLAINYNLTNDKVIVKVRYDNVSSDNKLVVYMVEDKLNADQANYDNGSSYSPAYQKGNPIPNFEHNNVLRTTLTATLGDAIPNNAISNKLYTTEYAITSATKGKFSNISNSKVIAFVVGKDGKAVNAQIATANEDKGFD